MPPILPTQCRPNLWRIIPSIWVLRLIIFSRHFPTPGGSSDPKIPFPLAKSPSAVSTNNPLTMMAPMGTGQMLRSSPSIGWPQISLKQTLSGCPLPIPIGRFIRPLPVIKLNEQRVAEAN